MKSVLTIFILLTVPFLPAQNQLRIISGSGELFTLWNGPERVDSLPRAEAVIDDVTEDTLRLAVEVDGKGKHSFVVHLLHKGKPVSGQEFTFGLVKSGGRPALEFLGMREYRPLNASLVPGAPAPDTMAQYRNKVLGHFCELKSGYPEFYNNTPRSGPCSASMPAGYMNYTRLLMGFAETADQRYRLAEQVCLNNCVSCAQLAALLGYVDFEVEKLRLIRAGWPNITDTSNVEAIEAALRFQSSKTELRRFVEGYGKRPAPGPACSEPATTKSLESILARLEAFSSDALKLDMLRRHYQRFCYTTAQAGTILSLFTHDREKLEAAKFLYHRCSDKPEFGSLQEHFNYPETVEALKNFLQKQEKQQ